MIVNRKEIKKTLREHNGKSVMVWMGGTSHMSRPKHPVIWSNMTVSGNDFIVKIENFKKSRLSLNFGMDDVHSIECNNEMGRLDVYLNWG